MLVQINMLRYRSAGPPFEAYRYIDDSFCESWVIPWIHNFDIVWEGSCVGQCQGVEEETSLAF